MFRPAKLAVLPALPGALLLCALVAAPAAGQDVYFTRDTVIDYPVPGFAFVGKDTQGHDSSPDVRVVNAGPGHIGSISGDLFVFNGSRVLTSGIIGGGLFGYGSSAITLSGGSVGASVVLANSSQITMRGGSVSRDMVAFDSSQVALSGGVVNGDLYLLHDSVVTITGGAVGQALVAYDNSRITISGGSFGGSQGVDFYATGDSMLTLEGENLKQSNPRLDPNLGGVDYDLSGTLTDGSNLNGCVLNISEDARLQFQTAAVVPEPGPIALTAGLITLGAGLLRRRARVRR